MIVELQLGTRLLRPTLRDVSESEVVIEQLDAGEDVPLRSVCWLARESPEEFETALGDDPTVDEAVQLVRTEYGCQYQLTYTNSYPGTAVYSAALDADGAFISGRATAQDWSLQYRFPGRNSLATFRQVAADADLDLSVAAIHEPESAPHAKQYGISQPQREILRLAAEEGYFEVPRDASLADLADELDVSSQAASERLRRGLDSLVGESLLTPE